MKIIILNHNLVGEGTWLRAWNLTRQLSAHHQVELIALSPTRRLSPRQSTKDGYRLVESPFWGIKRLAASGFSFVDTLARIYYIITRRWDVIYLFSSLPNVSIPFILAKRLFPRRRFISDWDDLFSDGGIYEYLNKGITRPLYRFERWLEYTVRLRADLVTVTSRFLEEKAREIGVTSPILYLPAGADVERIYVQNKDDARRELNLPGDRCIVYFLGGGFNNDCLLLLQAFAIAYKTDPTLFLVLTGDRCAAYTQAIAELDLADVVFQTGRIPYNRVPQYLGAADILAMPLHDCMNSRARGPIKLRDYLCAGRPIVGTALGEVKEVLENYDVGILANLSPESFASGIVNLARNPAHRDRMGKEARRVAEEELPWSVIGEKLLCEIDAIERPGT